MVCLFSKAQLISRSASRVGTSVDKILATRDPSLSSQANLHFRRSITSSTRVATTEAGSALLVAAFIMFCALVLIKL